MNPSKLRAAVFARDHGVCSMPKCSCDTESIRLGYEAALAAARERHAAVIRECPGIEVSRSAQRLDRELRDIRERLEALGFKPGQALFHVHHVLALAEGGRNELANCCTVCTRCHHPLTQETRARLARKPVKHLLELHETRDGKMEWR